MSYKHSLQAWLGGNLPLSSRRVAERLRLAPTAAAFLVLAPYFMRLCLVSQVPMAEEVLAPRNWGAGE